jgi:hypothetical protein
MYDKMGKAIQCKLIFHGQRRQIDMGEFSSKAKAKRYVQEVGWNRPYSILSTKYLALKKKFNLDKTK